MAAPLEERFALFGSRQRMWDYAFTFGTEFLALLTSFVVFRLAAHRWGETGFGEYVLMRRTVSMVQLPLMLGMAVAVTRYVAMALSSGRRPVGEVYLMAAVASVTASAGVAALVLELAPGPIGFLMFGDSAYRHLARVMPLPLTGLLLHGVAYGYLRGRLDMRAANGLQAINLAVLPLAVFLLPGVSVPQVFTLMGAGWCVVAGGAVIAMLISGSPSSWSRGDLRVATRELATYGAPRVIGDLALGALFTLPPIFAAHLEGVAEAGYIGLGISLVSLMGSLFAPVGHIILPSVSAQVKAGRLGAVRRDVARIGGAALLGTAVMVIALELLLAPLLAWYLGPEFRGGVPAIRGILPAALPFVAYVVLRNVLDAARVRPYNAKNLSLGVAVFVIWTGTAGSARAVAPAFVFAILVVGFLSAYDAVSNLRRPVVAAAGNP